MDAKQEYVWAVSTAKDDRVVALFSNHTAAQEHRRRLGQNGYRLNAVRVWDESYLGIGAVLTQRADPPVCGNCDDDSPCRCGDPDPLDAATGAPIRHIHSVELH